MPFFLQYFGYAQFSASDCRSDDVSVSDSDGTLFSSDFSRHSHQRHHCLPPRQRMYFVLHLFHDWLHCGRMLVIHMFENWDCVIKLAFVHFITHHLCSSITSRCGDIFTEWLQSDTLESRVWHLTQGDIYRRCCWQTYPKATSPVNIDRTKKIELVFVTIVQL